LIGFFLNAKAGDPAQSQPELIDRILSEIYIWHHSDYTFESRTGRRWSACVVNAHCSGFYFHSRPEVNFERFENKTPVLSHQGFFFGRGEKILFYGYLADIQL